MKYKSLPEIISMELCNFSNIIQYIERRSEIGKKPDTFLQSLFNFSVVDFLYAIFFILESPNCY